MLHRSKETTSAGDDGTRNIQPSTIGTSSLGSSNIGSSNIGSSDIVAAPSTTDVVRNVAVAGHHTGSSVLSSTSSSLSSGSTYPSSGYSSGYGTSSSLSSGLGTSSSLSSGYGTSSSLSTGSTYPSSGYSSGYGTSSSLSSGLGTSSSLSSGYGTSSSLSSGVAGVGTTSSGDYGSSKYSSGTSSGLVSSTPAVSSLSTVPLTRSSDWTDNKLTLVVHRAINVPKSDMLSKTDPYVRVRFDDQRPKDAVKGHKSVDKDAINPMFEQKFLFDLTGTERELLIELMDADILKDDVIGFATIPIDMLKQNADQQPFIVNLQHKKHKKHQVESQIELSVLRGASSTLASKDDVVVSGVHHSTKHSTHHKHEHEHHTSTDKVHSTPAVAAPAVPTTIVPAAIAASSVATPREEDIFDKIARKLHLQDEAPAAVTEVPASAVKRNALGEGYIPTAAEERRTDTK